MSMQERLARNDSSDQIYIGELVERTTAGEFGRLLKALIEGIIDETILNDYHKEDVSAQIKIGRIEGLKMLQERLDDCVQVKNQLLSPIETDEAPQG